MLLHLWYCNCCLIRIISVVIFFLFSGLLCTLQLGKVIGTLWNTLLRKELMSPSKITKGWEYGTIHIVCSSSFIFISPFLFRFIRSLSSLIAHKNWGQGNEKWKIREKRKQLLQQKKTHWFTDNLANCWHSASIHIMSCLRLALHRCCARAVHHTLQARYCLSLLACLTAC